MYALATLLDPCYKGRLFAPDKLEAIKQWAIDEARFEPSNLPANTPQPPPAKKACAGPLDVLDAILGAPAPTSSASAASLVDAELSAYLQADVISRAESPTEWLAANAARYPLLAAEAKCYLSDCKNRRSEISLHKIGDRPFLLNRPNSISLRSCLRSCSLAVRF